MLYMRWMGRNGTIFMEKMKETNFPRLSKFYPKWDVCVCVSSGAQRGRQMKEKIVEKNVPHQDKNGEENAESGDDGTKQCHRHTVEIHRRGRGRVEYLATTARSEIENCGRSAAHTTYKASLVNLSLCAIFSRFVPPLVPSHRRFAIFVFSFFVASLTWFMPFWLAEHFAYLISNLAS